MGLHQPLPDTGMGSRQVPAEGEGKVCCKSTLQNHASPKNKLSFQHRGAQRAARKDQWMGMEGSLCSAGTGTVPTNSDPTHLSMQAENCAEELPNQAWLEAALIRETWLCPPVLTLP